MQWNNVFFLKTPPQATSNNKADQPKQQAKSPLLPTKAWPNQTKQNRFPISTIVLLSLQGCQTGCFIAFWGLGFACLDKREAEKTVLISLVVACAVYGLGSLVPVEWGGVFLAGVLKSLGTLPFLLGLYDMDVVERAPLPENYSLLKPFLRRASSLEYAMAALPARWYSVRGACPMPRRRSASS